MSNASVLTRLRQRRSFGSSCATAVCQVRDAETEFAGIGLMVALDEGLFIMAVAGVFIDVDMMVKIWTGPMCQARL
jgi:hypothetical protein